MSFAIFGCLVVFDRLANFPSIVLCFFSGMLRCKLSSPSLFVLCSLLSDSFLALHLVDSSQSFLRRNLRTLPLSCLLRIPIAEMKPI